MREHFHDELNVAEIVGTLKISRRSFEKRFRLALGRTPHEEITRLRIRHAETLLTLTRDSIPIIAQKAGFGSERRFGENFRKLVGASPRTYRKKFAEATKSTAADA